VNNGWNESAAGWIADTGDEGDFARKFVLDAPMLERLRDRGFATALDVGCGEGRFCRMLKPLGIAATGIDPTAALVEEARRRDPDGSYSVEGAEALSFADASFDLVVSYLSLIDIPDAAAAIAEMSRVLRPGGTLLIANLHSMSTAGPPTGWVKHPDGTRHFPIDNYMDERSTWVGWRGIRIQNWHRPLSTYLSLLLGAGLELRLFCEPMPDPAADADEIALFRRVPNFLLMEWQKPAR
jgi:SAM-dependent methyltransferase